MLMGPYLARLQTESSEVDVQVLLSWNQTVLSVSPCLVACASRGA